jgi:hypothetical protein
MVFFKVGFLMGQYEQLVVVNVRTSRVWSMAVAEDLKVSERARMPCPVGSSGDDSHRSADRPRQNGWPPRGRRDTQWNRKSKNMDDIASHPRMDAFTATCRIDSFMKGRLPRF